MYEPAGFSLDIFKSRYSFTEVETWAEACARVAQQVVSAEIPTKQAMYREKFTTALQANVFVPGGRIWANAGRVNASMLNCVSGDTQVHIRGGKVLARDLVGQEVEVLSKGGVYRKAKWSSYGIQPLLKVVLENGDELFATSNHEWEVRKGSHNNIIVPTTKLKGCKIPQVHVMSPIINNTFREGIKHGMVYGDGSITRRGKKLCCEIRQFGSINTDVLLEYFKDEKLCTYNCKKYGTIHYATHLPIAWKALPSYKNDQSYLRGFIAGLIATDGHFDKRGHGGIYQSNLDALIIIRELASIAGLPTNGISLYRKYSPFDGSEKPNYKLSFYRNSICDNIELLIKESHKQNMLTLPQFQDRHRLQAVIDVSNSGRTEEVYCCVEPETHTMVIGNGYLTKQCFVLDPNKDSSEGWGASAYNMIVTSMRGGGCGDDFSDVRPRGSSIAGQRGLAPGAVELMHLIDACAKPVRSGGQRRVALMFSLDLDHPDIEEFLNAKLVLGQLTNANVSVKCRHTGAFIKAIKNDGEIELQWKGRYRSTVRARNLWNTIVTNAYNSAEPGFLNWELVEEESNIHYIEGLVSTNPCGELALASMEPCCLGHVVLSRFVKDGDINYAELANTIRLGVRFLDNVLTINHFPLPAMADKSHSLRRIGLGTTALADTLALLGYRYGSSDGNKFVDKLFRFISKVAYESSIMLAVEKGPFPLCDPRQHVESGYMKRMPAKIKSLLSESGIRNCAILTQAPTGTVSILSGNCSAGIEPMFAPAYQRRYWVGEERKVQLVFHPLFAQFMREGKATEHFVSARDLSVRDHLEVQRVVQRHIDNAVSKTINIPESLPMEEMEAAWLEYLPHLKGTTFYRENTRGYVNKIGIVEPPPLTALSLEEAREAFYKQKDTVESSPVDCVSGVCDL